ncbi:MAG: hypothetical protein CMN28_09625 [Salinisphaeraceae bacterium]|nr:hypothetical protein [Salinisphaeraceae bacterium]
MGDIRLGRNVTRRNGNLASGSHKRKNWNPLTANKTIFKSLARRIGHEADRALPRRQQHGQNNSGDGHKRGARNQGFGRNPSQ